MPKERTIALLKARNLQLVPTTEKPVLDLYGIDNVKEVANVVCQVANSAVNKVPLAGYLPILPALFPAIDDFDKVDDELLDMTEEEFGELKAYIANKLDFEGEADVFEELVEDLAIHVLGIVIAIIRYGKLKAQQKAQNSTEE